MKKLFACVCAGLMALTLTACGGKDEGSKELVVQTNSGYNPYEMVDAEGNLYGFDIDLMNALAQEAGYSVKWEDVDFDGIVSSVKTGKADIGIAGITYSAKRAKQVDFSDIYYAGEDAQNYVLTNDDGKMKTTDDIKGKIIGTQIGTIQEAILTSIKDEYNLTIDQRKSYADLAVELKKHVVDAMVVEKKVAEEIMEVNEGLTCYKLEAGSELAGNAMIFKKESPLKDEFNAALKALKENGKLDELIKKYF